MEMKYVDAILDRKNKFGKLNEMDKKYLSKFSNGENVSDLEKDYDILEEFRNKIFNRKPNPNWEFFISKGYHETIPIFYEQVCLAEMFKLSKMLLVNLLIARVMLSLRLI